VADEASSVGAQFSGEALVMGQRPHPPGYHCSKALRRLGLEAEAISLSLRRRLGLDTGEIAEVLAYPITPPDGVTAVADLTSRVDITDSIETRDESSKESVGVDRRRRTPTP
jgi:hypothetical protein